MKFILGNTFCIILTITFSPIFLIQYHIEEYSNKKEYEKLIKEKLLNNEYENICKNYF